MLPYKLSGLQLQNPILTADAALLASLSSFASLTRAILRLPPLEQGVVDLTTMIDGADELVRRYNEASGAQYDAHQFPLGRSQKELSEPILEREYDAFLSSLSNQDRARVLSNSHLLASAHLLAVPNPHFGTKISSRNFQKIIQFRLGVVTGSQQCAFCGEENDRNGTHQTTCAKSGLAHMRHNMVRNAILLVLKTASVSTEKETPGLVPGTNQRPGDIVVHDFTTAGPTPCDVTIVSPTCSHHLPLGIQGRGLVANQADDNKRKKYRNVRIYPLGLESHGYPSRGTKWFLHRVADRMLELEEELGLDKLTVMSQRLYIYQKVMVALQVANARMIILCGDPRLAQRERDNPSVHAPLVDLTFAEWQGVR